MFQSLRVHYHYVTHHLPITLHPHLLTLLCTLLILVLEVCAVSHILQVGYKVHSERACAQQRITTMTHIAHAIKVATEVTVDMLLLTLLR